MGYVQDVDYTNADITNQADWEIREELDEADRDLDEGVSYFKL